MVGSGCTSTHTMTSSRICSSGFKSRAERTVRDTRCVFLGHQRLVQVRGDLSVYVRNDHVVSFASACSSSSFLGANCIVLEPGQTISFG